MAVDEHAGRYSISSISGSHPHLVQVNAKVNTYGKPPNFPKTSNEVFPSRRGWKGPRPSTGELLESAALVSEAKAGNASMRDTRARYCVDTGSLYCECFPDIPAMSRNTEDKDSGNGDLFPEVCRCAEKIQTERDKFFDKAVRAIKSHEKIALIDKSNLFTSQTGKSLAAISKTIFETAGKVDECLKQLLRFEGGILEVLHCVESSRARRDCLKIKDAVAFLLDIRESIKMSELLAEKEEPLASAQIASRCSRLLASPERHLFGETAEVGEVICINELRSKLDSIVCDMRLRLTNCLLDSIYTSLSGVIEARDLSDLDVNDNEDLTRRYMPSIAPALIELDFHPAITQNYSKMLIEACLSLPEKLFKYALNVDSSEINPRKCNDAKNAIMVSAFRTTYASLITLFERVMYCHSILIDATPDLQRDDLSMALERTSNKLGEVMDNGSSDLLWSVFSDDSNSLTMRDKADISSLTQNFIDRLAVSSASRRMETSDALITCLNNAFSDYHMVVIKTIKLLAAQPSQYSNFVVDDSVVFLFEEPGFGECYSRMGISQFLKTENFAMTVISQKFLHAISDYIHVAKSATFLRVNVINKLVELINTLSSAIVEMVNTAKNCDYSQSTSLLASVIKTLCLVAHPIAYLKYEMNNLIPANQKFLLSDFDILEKKCSRYISTVKNIKIRLIEKELQKHMHEWEECYNKQKISALKKDPSLCMDEMRGKIATALDISHYPFNLKEEIYLEVLNTCIKLGQNAISNIAVGSMKVKMRIFQDINGLVELFNSYEYTANLAYELEVYANDITIIDIHDRNDVVRADSLKSDDTGGNMHASDRSPETKTNSQPPMHGGLLSRSKKKSLTSTIASAFDGILKRETGLERNRNSKL